MAVVGGLGDDFVDYKFQFSFQKLAKWELRETRLSNIFSHGGDFWQMEVTKVEHDPEWDRFDCVLHLVKTNVAKKNIAARMCLILEGDMFAWTPTAIYNRSGATSDPWECEMVDDQEPKIVVEVFKSIEVSQTQNAQTSAADVNVESGKGVTAVA